MHAAKQKFFSNVRKNQYRGALKVKALDLNEVFEETIVLTLVRSLAVHFRLAEELAYHCRQLRQI